MGPELQAVIIAFAVTVAMLLALRPVARAVGLIDKPGGRKMHVGDVPVIGGIGIFIGLLCAVTAGPEITRNIAVRISAAGLMVLLGVIDDRFNLRPRIRLVTHIAAATFLVLGTGYVVESFGHIFGIGDFELGVWAWPFTVVACVALVNACNMLDGMDGLAGGASLVACGAFLVVAVLTGASGVATMCAGLVGGLVAFLLFNLPANFNRRVRTFMGDAGSTLLGFTMATAALVLVQPDKANMAPAYVLWFVPIPIFELFTSVCRRLREGKSPMFADAGHFHHSLLLAGFSVRLIFAIYFGFSVLCASLGLTAFIYRAPEWLLFIGFIGTFAGWLLFIRTRYTIAAHLPLALRHDRHNLGAGVSTPAVRA